jgi:hypothetical protein
MKRRRLVSLRREVPAGQLQHYAAAWRTLQSAVTETGAHAWRFVSAAYPGLHLEFLEFAAGADPRERAEIAGALAALERLAAATTEEWDEANL